MNEPRSESSRPEPADRPRVLLLGHRAGLVRVLRRQGIPFVLWTDREPKHTAAEVVHVATIPASPEAVKRILTKLPCEPPFTHVIAGGEFAVVAASIARRFLGARAAPFAIALRCRDKLTMKQHLRRHAVPMTDFLDGAQPHRSEEVFARLGHPVVVKDRRSSGGRRIVLAHDARQLEAAPRRGTILERFVEAPEVSVESFVHEGSIQFESITEYRVKTSINVVPAALDPALVERVLALNRQVIRALRISWGITHLEMYLSAEGPLFGEVALRPPGGYIMHLIGLAWGFDAWEAFVAMELGSAFEFPEEPCAHAGAWILHPGAGRLVRVHGLDAVRGLPGVHELKLKAGVGDSIGERGSVSDDIGRLLFRTDDAWTLGHAIDAARSTLRFELEEP